MNNINDIQTHTAFVEGDAVVYRQYVACMGSCTRMNIHTMDGRLT